MAQATAPAPSREVLLDRYRGLEYTDYDGEEWTDQQQKLSGVLGDFVQGTARCHRDDVGEILDELFVLIRDHIVTSIERDGIPKYTSRSSTE